MSGMRAKTVDEYISRVPEEFRERLKHLRKAIREAVPEAEEKISYGMPYYGYKGRLVYFAWFKSHISVFIPPPVPEDHKKELKGYVWFNATIQFPHDRPLPVPLIVSLVLARKKINAEKE